MNLSESRVRAIVKRHEQLTERADEVAHLVFRAEHPNDSFPSYFTITYEDGKVYAAYYFRSNDYVLAFPLEYLWLSNGTVATRAHEEIERREQAKLLATRDREQREAQAAEERDRQTFLRLKARFESEDQR